MPVANWMKTAVVQSNKPQDSIIGVLRKNLAGYREGRSRDVVHASDITKPNFCPRKWAFEDMTAKMTIPEFLGTALAVTYAMGSAAEHLFLHDWARDAAVGDWKCQGCGNYRTMTTKPLGCPSCGKNGLWEYQQIVIESPQYNVSGAIDCLFDVGVPKLLITEIKTMNAADFDTIAAPLPEHRLRTNLYMKLVADSNNVYKDRFNLHQAKVLYISRAHGKKNLEWGEVLPFKEYTIERNDLDLALILKKAKQLKIFREQKLIPSGICQTILDKPAKTCSCDKMCFSGDYFSQQEAL